MNKIFNVSTIAVFIIAMLGFSGCIGEKNATAEKEAASVQKALETTPASQNSQLVVANTPAQLWVSVSGVALPFRDSILSAEVSGKISKIPVIRGQRVKRGELLLQLESDSFRYQVQQAEAAVEVAKVSAEQMQRDFNRIEKLKNEESVAQSNFERTRAQLEAARAQVKQAEAGLAMAKNALLKTEVRAPFDGVITQLMHEVGEMVTLMPATALVRLVDASSLEVQTYLPESETPFIRVGSKAQLIVESAAQEVEGEIIFVSNQMQAGTQTFEIRIKATNPDSRVKAGAFAKLRIKREWSGEAHFIPLAAIGRSDDEQAFVRVETASGIDSLPVKLGPVLDGLVLVEGLPGSDFKLLSAEAAIVSSDSEKKAN